MFSYDPSFISTFGGKVVAWLYKSLNKLFPFALRLFYLQEMSMKEVQEVTGWSLGNTKVILHRARNRFQVELNSILKTEAKNIL